MRKIVLFMHTSLDGFVAGPNGEMDWINTSPEMFDYAAERTNHSDTALYGRVTYQMMDSYWPTAADQPGASRHDIEHSKWYNEVAKVVVSKTMKGQHPRNTKIVSDDLANTIGTLKQLDGKDILIFGSPSVVHSLMEHGLIDDFWLFVNSIILGSGIPLFKNKDIQRLKLIAAKTFSSEVVCLHYEKK